LDIIWFSQNKLVHDDHHLDPAKLIIQHSSTLGLHLEAWNAASSPSLWTPPGVDGINGNFDVDVRESFAVADTVISDYSGNIIMAATQQLHSTDILAGEASAALLASRLALSSRYDHFIIEGDALLVILAINSPEYFSLWNFPHVSRCVNYRAHALAKWTAFHLVFRNISIGSLILSSIRIESGKDPLL
jgi:hypothetical protein